MSDECLMAKGTFNLNDLVGSADCKILWEESHYGEE